MEPTGTSPNTISSEEKDFRQWAMFLHLSMLLGYVVPIAGLIAPIVIWQVKKNEMPAIDEHGKNATNWIISALIYAVVSSILVFVIVGVFLLIALAILSIIFPIIAGVKANNGETWKYPLTIAFIK